MRLLCRDWFCFVLALGFASASHAASPATRPVITWDASTLRCVQRGGGYGRIARDGADLICCYEWHGRCWVRISHDDGLTWQNGVDVVGFAHGYAANPEPLVCPDRILLFYNERPREAGHAFAICEATSRDHGQTWTVAARPIFTAAPVGGVGCYEPAAVQQSDGAIDLFFANEYPYPPTNGHATFQEIDTVRSRDGGESWSPPKITCYRPDGRDGMPVPLTLLNRSLVLAIEDNRVLADHLLKPMVIGLGEHFDATQPQTAPPRWNPLRIALAPGGYGGAPYLRQFADGTTILSFQTCQPPQPQHVAVYLGNADARDFVAQPPPFAGDRYSMWNSLLIKDARTVTLVSTAEIDGVRGIWTIDGRLTSR